MALLKAQMREAAGTRKARSLRAKDLIPAIVYGHGEATVPIALNRHDLQLAVGHGERLLEIDMDGKTQNVLVKEVQYDAMGNDLLHIDLARVNLDELVEVTVPVRLRGTPIGAMEGGVIQQTVAQITIECMVRSIPEDIRATVDHMKVGDKLLMKELALPQGAKLLQDPDMIVATCSVIAEEVIAAPEEAAVIPEVIGEKKEEEAAEGAEAAAPEKKKEKEKE